MMTYHVQYRSTNRNGKTGAWVTQTTTTDIDKAHESQKRLEARGLTTRILRRPR